MADDRLLMAMRSKGWSRKFPQSPQHLVFRTALDEEFVVVVEDEPGGDVVVRYRGFFLFDGKRFGRPGSEGGADGAKEARGTARRLGRADRRAKLHHRLVEIARS